MPSWSFETIENVKKKKKKHNSALSVAWVSQLALTKARCVQHLFFFITIVKVTALVVIKNVPGEKLKFDSNNRKSCEFEMIRRATLALSALF